MWEANPPSVAKGDLRKLARPNWSVPLSLLAGDWLIIGMAVALSTYTDNFWVYIFCAGVVGSRQHALFVLVHEGVHKHLARSKRVNDWISNLFAAYPILFDTEAYRENHLRHHEHLNTDQDPDWTRKKGHSEWKFPQKTRNLVLFLPYFICIRGALEWLQIVLAFSGIFVNHIAFPRMRKRLAVKIVYYTCVGVTITYLNLWPAMLKYWLIPMFFIFPLLQRIRSVAEHFGLPWAHDLNSTRDVVASGLELFFLAPHAVNYHLTHHLYPAIPCYHLKETHRLLMQDQVFQQNAHINGSYLLGSQNSVLGDIIRPAATSSHDPERASA